MHYPEGIWGTQNKIEMLNTKEALMEKIFDLKFRSDTELYLGEFGKLYYVYIQF